MPPLTHPFRPGGAFDRAVHGLSIPAYFALAAMCLGISSGDKVGMAAFAAVFVYAAFKDRFIRDPAPAQDSRGHRGPAQIAINALKNPATYLAMAALCFTVSAACSAVSIPGALVATAMGAGFIGDCALAAEGMRERIIDKVPNGLKPIAAGALNPTLWFSGTNILFGASIFFAGPAVLPGVCLALSMVCSAVAITHSTGRILGARRGEIPVGNIQDGHTNIWGARANLLCIPIGIMTALNGGVVSGLFYAVAQGIFCLNSKRLGHGLATDWGNRADDPITPPDQLVIVPWAKIPGRANS